MMSAEAEKWKKRYEREKSSRSQAERLLEQKSKDLYEANKRLEEQVLIETSKLKLEEEKSRAVHQASLDGIMLHSTEGVILDVNEKLCELVSRSKADLIGIHTDNLLADESIGFFGKAMNEVSRSGYVRSGCLFKRGDGSVVSTEVSVAQFEAEGSVIVQAVVRDVTERIQSAKSLEAATKDAIHANEAKSLFLATMSHEIRTPLNGIIGFTEILLQESLAEEHRQHLELIRKSGDMLLHIITDILDFSRVENNDIELDEINFSMVECIEETLDVQAKTASNKDVDLLYKIDADFPKYLYGDSGRIRQILLNLVSNGLKFTSHGSVVIRAKKLNEETLEVSVTDTGIGFDMRVAKKLFEPFQQADASTTRKFGGTGLGLAICSRLISAMSGTITAESKVGKGACFKITFPFSPARSAILGVKKPEDFTNLIAGHALVVDDHIINLKFMQARLQQWGFEVTVVSSAKEALDLIHAGERFQIILTDYLMPDMDGVDLTKKIVQTLREDTPPILLVTSSRLAGEKRVAIAAGVDAVIYKPVRERVLLDALYKALNKEVDVSGKLDIAVLDEPSSSGVKGWQSHVLVVEDNPINAQLAKILIENLGAKVEVSINGEEALKALNTNDRYDVIMMDMQMPVMGGLEATKRIRSGEGGIHYLKTPIIAMTANAQKQVKEECLEAGMNDYIPKPIRVDRLERILKSYGVVS